jgi:D-3-phosphoglycerate dehydrogenase / 2-oxoglutarate reductase
MFRVLVTDDVDPEGLALLAAEPQLQVDEVPTLPKDELLARIGDYDAIVGRSATRISPELLKAGTKLKVVGRAGVGVDNVAVDVATSLGIAVINAPAGNTVAVAELFFGAAIGLLRQIPRAQSVMENGRWDRNTFLGRELKGKTLGIVGLGRIGSEVATRAHAFGMTVVGYDPYIADERFIALRVRRAPSLDALLHETNILTVHVPLTDETKGMIGKRELARLPNRSVVVNMARGGIVDEAALLAALESEQLRGAALDVFDAEPLAADSPLRKAPNLLLTPHLGANTVEAQRNVSRDVCLAVRDGRRAWRPAARSRRRRSGAGRARRSGHARRTPGVAAREPRHRPRHRRAARECRGRRARRGHRNRSPQPHQRALTSRGPRSRNERR